MLKFRLLSLFILAFILHPSSFCLALTDAWSVNVNDHTAVQRTYKRGESIDLRITLRDGLRPLDLTGATARWYWYTNAVDNLWWTNSAAIPTPKAGLVSAQWTPSMDTGASLYPYWVGLWLPGSTSPLWRVNGTIRLLGSPGLNPNSHPVPVRTLDFAAITVTNAPWATSADWASGSNALAGALQFGLTNTVPARIAAAISAIPPYVETDSDALSALAEFAASNRVSTVYESATNWWTLGTNTARRTSVGMSPSIIAVVFDADFMSQTAQRPPEQWYPYDAVSGLVVGDWTVSTTYGGHLIMHTDSSSWSGSWVSVQPEVLYPSVLTGTGGSGTAYIGPYSPLVTNHVDYVLTTGDVWQAVATAQETADEALFAADGASGTINNHMSAGNAHAALLSNKLSQAQGDARYLSSTPGWFLQGSQVISTSSWTTNLTGYAATTNGMIALVPYTTSRHDVTGTVTVTAQRYIVGVSAAFAMAQGTDPTIPKSPMFYRAFERVSRTSFVAWATCSVKPTDANPYYFAYVSNIIVQTYDRAEMEPNSYTNDQAGIVARVDSLPTSGGVPVTSDGRAVVNAESMRLYVDARKEEIAKAAFRYTPSGRPSPSAYTFTVDQPLIQQGQISYLQSGDYWVQSYEGGDWRSETVGGEWSMGASGSKYFGLTSTNRQAHVQNLSVSGGYATLDISTNWLIHPPVIEFTDTIDNQQWLECPAQVMTDMGGYWRGVCPATVARRFFRAVSRQGNNSVKSYYVHEFAGGIKLGTNTFTTLSELKAQLEALP